MGVVKSMCVFMRFVKRVVPLICMLGLFIFCMVEYYFVGFFILWILFCMWIVSEIGMG